MNRLLLTIGALLLAFLLMQWFRADYIEFDRRREAWHRRCDVFIATPMVTPAAQDCSRELGELTAYAKRKGW